MGVAGLIYCDTREKENGHILRYLEQNEIPYEVRKIDCGDYMIEGQGNVRVERKRNLQELAHNLCSPDRARFYREVRRAREAGIRLIVLCEHGGEIRDLASVGTWKPKYGKVSGKTLRDAIYALMVSYGVPVVFCGKRSTGKRIVQLLTEVGEDETDDV